MNRKSRRKLYEAEQNKNIRDMGFDRANLMYEQADADPYTKPSGYKLSGRIKKEFKS